jgi:hypothetical protein
VPAIAKETEEISMTIFNRVATFAACTLALGFIVATAEPALAKDPVPYNAQDAAKKYCGRAYNRYCSKVPKGGIESLNCLKQNIARLPGRCRKAVQQL